MDLSMGFICLFWKKSQDIFNTETLTEKGRIWAGMMECLISFYAFLWCLSFLILCLHYFIFNRGYLGKEMMTFCCSLLLPL